MRMLVRAILAVALLLGGGGGDWLPASAQGHESCCCGVPASSNDTCPCPKPESNRGPSRTNCIERTATVATVAVRRTQIERRVEPRPEPTTWVLASLDVPDSNQIPSLDHGRDPDLGRHLARLSTLLI